MTSRLLGAVAALGLAGAAGGILVAGLAMPLVSGAGLAARNATSMFTRLPPPPSEDRLPEMTRLLDRNGRQIAQFYYQNRQSVPLDRVAPAMRQAIVAIEDSRFYEHGGLDVKGTLRALIANTRAGGIRQGGSSITQQLVKNIMVTQAETPHERALARVRNIHRKITELRYALALEQKYTKDEILERYLNIAYFGAGAFGVQAAAQRFFGVDAADLTLPQAATLAGAVRAPYVTDPSIGAEQRARLLDRRNLVLGRMAELRMIGQGAARTAQGMPLGLRMRAEPGGCGASVYPFFCVYVQQEVLTNPAFGSTRAERERRLQRGGLTLWTTVDPVAQRAAERAISARVRPRDPQVAAESMIEPGTGFIRAMAVSKRYGRNPKNRSLGPRTTYNLAADQAHGGGLGLQAGSTFKAFTLATALSQGMRFGDGFQIPGAFVPAGGYRNCSGKAVNDPRTTIHNAGGEGRGGPLSLEMGTWNSVNIFFMELERHVGLCNVVRTAQALGIARADGQPLHEVPTFTLGANEMDPTTVAAAFAAFAARGRYCRPVAITAVVGKDGSRRQVPQDCVTALEPEVADAVNHVLSGVFTRGTMRGQSIGRPQAGKTGTNNGYASAWFAGYTPTLAAAVSIGDIRGSYRYPLTGVTIGGRYYGAVQGASLPGPIWVDSMRQALRGTPAYDFVPPDMDRFGGGFTPGLKEFVEKEKKKRKREAERRERRHDEQQANAAQTGETQTGTTQTGEASPVARTNVPVHGAQTAKVARTRGTRTHETRTHGTRNSAGVGAQRASGTSRTSPGSGRSSPRPQRQADRVVRGRRSATQPAHTRPAHTRPAGTMPARTRPVKTRPVKTKPAEARKQPKQNGSRVRHRDAKRPDVRHPDRRGRGAA
ncbi:transglycosylase domain-containing protein [Sphaerimonospora cavernae]|uniref:Transglycosylase domain-containing protein n=1 Tax=Sphaerimonospora cavernae TaxID=1740611 RepID=A0ABV6TXC5_9ACTN